MSYITTLKREVVIKKKRCKDLVYPKDMYVRCFFLKDGMIGDMYDHFFVFNTRTRKIVPDKAIFAIRYAHANHILEDFIPFSLDINKTPTGRDAINGVDWCGCPAWDRIIL